MKDTTAALRAREQHYRQLVEILPDAVALIDLEGRITAVNPQACAMLGYSESADLLGKSIFDITLSERQERVKADIAATIATGGLRNREAMLQRRNGEYFPVELSAAILNDAQRNPIGIVSVMRDITKRKEAETRLRESEERFRQLAENIREVFWMTDPAKNQIIYVSPGYEEIWGRDCEGLYASPRSWLEAIHPDDRERVLQAALTKQTSGQYAETYRIVRPDGAVRWIEDRAFAIRNQCGEVYRVVGVAADVSDKVRAAKRSDAISRLGHRLSAAHTREEAAEIILEIGSDLFDWDAGYLNLYSAKVDKIVPLLTVDTVGNKRQQFPPASLPAAPTPLMRRIMREGPAILDPATVEETGLKLVPFGNVNRRARTMMLAPIRASGAVIGLVSVQSYRLNAYNQEDLNALQTLADICGGALHRIAMTESLHESEARKTAIMESALDGIVTVDRAGRIVEFNSAAEKIIGCNRASAIGKELAGIFVPPSLREWFHSGLARFFNADEGPMLGGRIETKGLRADGTEFPVEFTITRVDFKGAALATIFIRDITGRRKAEAQLATLAHAVESTGEPIRITDLNDRFTFVNRAFQKTYGYQGEILGKTPEILFSPNNPPTLMEEILTSTRSGGWRGEVLELRKDGTEFPILLTTSQIKDQSGRILGLMGVVEDITERKRAEEQIRLLADAVQSTQEMISITDAENRFTFVNEAFLRAYGYEPEEVVGRTPELLYSANNPAGLCETVFRETLAGGWRGELLNCRKNGAEFPISLGTSQIKNRTGKIIGLVGVARDISEHRRAEKQHAAFSLVGHRLSGVNEPEEAAQIILDIAGDLFGWDAAYVHAYSEAEDKIVPLLTIDTVHGKRTPISPTTFTLDPSRLMRQVMEGGGRLMNHGKGGVTPPDSVPFGHTAHASASMMYVPIRFGGVAIGVLSVQSYAANAYSKDDLRLLQALADYCGNALQRVEVAHALRAAEGRYRSIFENATEGIFQTTEDGRYLNANPALARMFGYTSPAKLISNVTNIERQTFVAAETGQELKRRLLEQDAVMGFEAERYRRDGTRFWTSINLRKVYDADGKFRHYEGTVQDITRRKQAQKQNQVLTGLGYGLSSAVTLEQAASLILDVASELFGWDAAYVHLYLKAEDKIMRVLTMDTIDGQRVATPPVRSTAEPSLMMRLVMREGAQLINAEDRAALGVPLTLFGNIGHLSATMMYVPIHSEGVIVGIMSIQNRTAGAYSPEDLRLLQTMADYCGSAFQRIKVTEALGEAEAKYRSIVENATEGIFRTTPDGQLLSANPALARMFGYESAEEMTSSITNVEQQIYVSPKSRTELKRLLETQSSVRGFEAENYRKDGSRIWTSLNGHAIRDAHGAVLYYQGTIQDITGRKWTDNLLHVQRDFGVLLSSTNDLRFAVDRLLRIALQSDGVDCGGVYLVDPETGGMELAAQHGLSARFNSRASHLSAQGNPPNSPARRQPLAAIVHELKGEKLMGKEVIPIQHSGRVVAVLIVGSHVQAEFPHRSRQALDAFAAQAGGAITRIRAEQLLRANKQLLDKTLNSLHDGVLLLEAKTGIVQECNKAATRIFGYNRDEILGRTRDFLHRPDALLDHLSQHLPVGSHERGFGKKFELQMKRKDGTLFPTEHSLTAIKDEAGDLISWVNVVRDITERKRVESDLRQLSQRIIEAQETERFRVARELHDGVNQIIASAKMRLRKVEDLSLSPAAREILARCDRLLVQALEENRRIAHNLRPSELDELGWASACRNFCQELQSRSNLTVKCRISRLTRRLSPLVELNLFRIVQEALSNVEKHAHAKTVRLQIAALDGSIQLHIRDDGTGFDPQRTRTHKRDRAGLGLSNMRERCAALGGSCKIESAPGKGTRITVRVPLENGSQLRPKKTNTGSDQE